MTATVLVYTERAQVRLAIAEYARTGDPGLREGIIAAHRGLAYTLAARFRRRGEEVDDLNQVALIGLMKAVDRFDPDRGVELSTFATSTILGELKRHRRDRDWSVRLPRRVHDVHLRAQQAIDDLTQELGRSPEMLEVAERVGAPLEDVLEAIDAGGLRHPASLAPLVMTGDEPPPGAGLGAWDDGMAGVDRRVDLMPLLSRLSEREQRILGLRFVAGCSQTEIAACVGLSQMQVSRLLARSLAKLRAWAANG